MMRLNAILFLIVIASVGPVSLQFLLLLTQSV